jgi:hypothetical protein
MCVCVCVYTVYKFVYFWAYIPLGVLAIFIFTVVNVLKLKRKFDLIGGNKVLCSLDHCVNYMNVKKVPRNRPEGPEGK